MEAVLIALVVLAALGVLGWLAWISVQSLLQGAVLRNAVPLAGLKDNLDRVVAIHGTPILREEGRGPFGFPVIWYKKELQEYRRHGKHGSWHTVDTDERVNPFDLEFPGGGCVRILSKPSEVQGGHSRTDQEGFFSRRRTVVSWLPVSPSLTVLGKLTLPSGGATLVPDGKLGLLFSTHTPGRAAAIETAKGVGGLLLILAALVAGVIVLVSVRA
jgi:hypothetical protein